MYTLPFQSILRLGELILQLIKIFTYHSFNHSSFLSRLSFPCGTCITHVRSPRPLPRVSSLPSQFSFLCSHLMCLEIVIAFDFPDYSYISSLIHVFFFQWEITFVTSTTSPKCCTWTSWSVLISSLLRVTSICSHCSTGWAWVLFVLTDLL